MLSPKRLKFRKMHKGRIHGLAKGGSELSFGSYGLKALTPDRITARQIEAARRAITREMKRAGRLWIRIFPDVPVSDKPAVWVKVKVLLSIGAQECTRAALCLRLTVLMKRPPATHLLSVPPNCRLRRSLSSALIPTREKHNGKN